MDWQITEKSALGRTAGGQIEVFPVTPQHAARLHVAPPSGPSWRIAEVFPLPQHAALPEEIYCRQHDLICRFGQSPSDEYGFQLDWQLLPPQGPFAAGVELWLSVSTAWLETHPELKVVCHGLDAGQWHVLNHDQLSHEPQPAAAASCGPAALLTERQADQGHPSSGLWLIEPSDQCQVALCPGTDGGSQAVRLFGQFMEKGVIRRGRMRFLLADQPVSREEIAEAYRQFALSPLPLTA